MKKVTFILAAIALIAASCAKKDDVQTKHDVSQQKGLTPLHVTLTLPDACETVTRAGFEKTDPSKPFKLKATWRTDEPMAIIFFQGDNANWKSNCLVHRFKMPASANGKTQADLTAAAGSVDLSRFNASLPLKYVVVNAADLRVIDPVFNLGNGVHSDLIYANTLNATHWYNDQLRYMSFATPVQEVPFPSGTLQIQGSLEWLTAALAVKFEFASGADLLMKDGSQFSLYLQGLGETYPNVYDPVLRKREDATFSYIMYMQMGTNTKLSDALDADGFRYFHIPADDNNGVQIRGTSVFLTASYKTPNDVNGVYLNFFNQSVPIKPGYCYGFKIKVTDADGNGVPEFAKAP